MRNLHAALGDQAAFEALLAQGADVSAVSGGMTVLALAALAGNTSAVRSLLQSGRCDANQQSVAGITALHAALFLGDGDMVRALIEHGADPRVPDEQGGTALRHAVDKEEVGDPSIFEPLLDRVDEADLAEALRIACRRGHAALVDLFLRRARPTAECLVEAVRSNSWNMVEKLLSPDREDNEGLVEALADADFSALLHLSLAGDTRLALFEGLLAPALAARPSAAAILNAGPTPALIKACQLGEAALAESLLELGADAAAVDASGFTALHRAVEGGFTQVIRKLAEHMPPGSLDAGQRTALEMALSAGHLGAAKVLVTAGAARDPERALRALQLAATKGGECLELAMALHARALGHPVGIKFEEDAELSPEARREAILVLERLFSAVKDPERELGLSVPLEPWAVEIAKAWFHAHFEDYTTERIPKRQLLEALNEEAFEPLGLPPWRETSRAYRKRFLPEEQESDERRDWKRARKEKADDDWLAVVAKLREALLSQSKNPHIRFRNGVAQILGLE